MKRRRECDVDDYAVNMPLRFDCGSATSKGVEKQDREVGGGGDEEEDDKMYATV